VKLGRAVAVTLLAQVVYTVSAPTGPDRVSATAPAATTPGPGTPVRVI
jgi:hypothetical protein